MIQPVFTNAPSKSIDYNTVRDLANSAALPGETLSQDGRTITAYNVAQRGDIYPGASDEDNNKTVAFFRALQALHSGRL